MDVEVDKRHLISSIFLCDAVRRRTSAQLLLLSFLKQLRTINFRFPSARIFRGEARLRRQNIA